MASAEKTETSKNDNKVAASVAAASGVAAAAPRERDPQRDKAIDLAVSTIEKQFGKGSIMRLGEDTAPPEVRVHVSAVCDDEDMAQGVEDEVYTLTICGPAGAGGVRSERRPRLDIVDGYIDRDLVPTTLEWAVS